MIIRNVVCKSTLIFFSSYFWYLILHIRQTYSIVIVTTHKNVSCLRQFLSITQKTTERRIILKINITKRENYHTSKWANSGKSLFIWVKLLCSIRKTFNLGKCLRIDGASKFNFGQPHSISSVVTFNLCECELFE